MRVALTAAAASLSLATSAHATLQFAADVNGATFVCADQAACDTNNTVGILGIPNQTLGGVQVNGSIAVQSTTGGVNLLDVSSLSIVNKSKASVPITVTVSGTDFSPVVTQAELTGSGTWTTAQGSNLTLTWFDDPGNAQGANTAGDTPGTKLGTFTSTVTLPIQSFSTDQFASVSDTAPFSMTLNASGTLVAGGSLLNRGQAEIKPFTTPAPEPFSLALLGTGLLGLAALRKRR